MISNKKGFTLIELLIVVVILSTGDTSERIDAAVHEAARVFIPGLVTL